MALVASLPLLLLSLLGLPSPALEAPGSPPRPNEYEVKAAFLYNFAKFVEWPSGRGDEPFVVAVVGDDPFGEALERTLAGKTVSDRRLVVRRAPAVEDVTGADIVFVSSSESARLPQVLKHLEGTPTLTVGEMDDFVGRGGMVGFRVLDDIVRFDVNLDRVSKARLKMSSQLVRIARRVISAAAGS
jgi:hypothetical protein